MFKAVCACCPPNLARVISSFGKYAYGENEDTVFCHLYAGGKVAFENGVKLLCKTEYPYGFDVVYTILEGRGKIAVRIPQWSKNSILTVNDEIVDCNAIKGYIYLKVNAGDIVKLTLDDTPYYVYPSAKIPELTGSVAICRGPLVYCFEGVDNGNDILSLSIKRKGKLFVGDADAQLKGAVKITAEAVRTEVSAELYTTSVPVETPCTAVAIPYYTWCNRGENQMRVWMTEAK
ncbi:MAG: glycoside hydrolase family 127 protein [Clostridia bacterium]|nr:glycoside hydrolase family 127 protein [Clostridia bacterium]